MKGTWADRYREIDEKHAEALRAVCAAERQLMIVAFILLSVVAVV